MGNLISRIGTALCLEAGDTTKGHYIPPNAGAIILALNRQPTIGTWLATTSDMKLSTIVQDAARRLKEPTKAEVSQQDSLRLVQLLSLFQVHTIDSERIDNSVTFHLNVADNSCLNQLRRTVNL